ncbi:MAG TPA: hypothetical protein VL172_05295, partial [Kofleriaceae bacterium]|nr:hypothetical protein [Kofleriaceae bacterium]
EAIDRNVVAALSVITPDEHWVEEAPTPPNPAKGGTRSGRIDGLTIPESGPELAIRIVEVKPCSAAWGCTRATREARGYIQVMNPLRDRILRVSRAALRAGGMNAPERLTPQQRAELAAEGLTRTGSDGRAIRFFAHMVNSLGPGIVLRDYTSVSFALYDGGSPGDATAIEAPVACEDGQTGERRLVIQSNQRGGISYRCQVVCPEPDWHDCEHSTPAETRQFVNRVTTQAMHDVFESRLRTTDRQLAGRLRGLDWRDGLRQASRAAPIAAHVSVQELDRLYEVLATGTLGHSGASTPVALAQRPDPGVEQLIRTIERLAADPVLRSQGFNEAGLDSSVRATGEVVRSGLREHMRHRLRAEIAGEIGQALQQCDRRVSRQQMVDRLAAAADALLRRAFAGAVQDVVRDLVQAVIATVAAAVAIVAAIAVIGVLVAVLWEAGVFAAIGAAIVAGIEWLFAAAETTAVAPVVTEVAETATYRAAPQLVRVVVEEVVEEEVVSQTAQQGVRYLVTLAGVTSLADLFGERGR